MAGPSIFDSPLGQSFTKVTDFFSGKEKKPADVSYIPTDRTPKFAEEEQLTHTIDDLDRHWVGENGPFPNREAAAAWDQERREAARAHMPSPAATTEEQAERDKWSTYDTGTPHAEPPNVIGRTSYGRAIVKNEDGSLSTKRTSTFQFPDGKWYNAPTMDEGGNPLTDEQAYHSVTSYREEEGSGSVEIFGSDLYRDPVTDQTLSGYGTREEAEAAAQEESDRAMENVPYHLRPPQLVEVEHDPFSAENDPLGERAEAEAEPLGRNNIRVTPGKALRRINQHLMDMMERGVTAPGEAYSGELQVIGPDGHVTDEAIARSIEMTLASIGGGAAANAIIKAAGRDIARGRLSFAGRGIRDQIKVKRRMRQHEGLLAADEPSAGRALIPLAEQAGERIVQPRTGAIGGVDEGTQVLGLQESEGVAGGSGGTGLQRPAGYGREHPAGSLEQGDTGAAVRPPAEVGARSPDLEPTAAQKAYDDSAGFFSGITTGELQSQIPQISGYEPVIPLRPQEKAFEGARGEFKHYFEDHIAASIPGHPEVQASVGSAIVRAYGKTGADVLDIGASEGALNKAITKASGGKIRTVALDPNLDFKVTFESKPQAEGATFVAEAFGTPEQAGKFAFNHETTPINYFDPKGQKFDVVHESMTFQFIDAERLSKFEAAKDLLKDDGVALFEQKVKADGTDAWATNEEAKNQFKRRLFTEQQLSDKQEIALVGMNEKMVPKLELEQALKDTFKHVRQYWDSGNFKGYIASESEAAIKNFLNGMQDTSSSFSNVGYGFKLSANPKEAAPLLAALTRDVDAMGFVSPTLEAAKRLPAKGTAQQMLKQLENKLGGKPKEIEATGLPIWIERRSRGLLRKSDYDQRYKLNVSKLIAATRKLDPASDLFKRVLEADKKYQDFITSSLLVDMEQLDSSIIDTFADLLGRDIFQTPQVKKGMVTRDEVVQYLRDNRVAVSEVALGKFEDVGDLDEIIIDARFHAIQESEQKFFVDEAQDVEGNETGEWVLSSESFGEEIGRYSSEDDAYAALTEAAEELAEDYYHLPGKPETVFSGYQQPHAGGEYTERLFHMPGHPGKFEGHHWQDEGVPLPIFAHQRVSYYQRPTLESPEATASREAMVSAMQADRRKLHDDIINFRQETVANSSQNDPIIQAKHRSMEEAHGQLGYKIRDTQNEFFEDIYFVGEYQSDLADAIREGGGLTDATARRNAQEELVVYEKELAAMRVEANQILKSVIEKGDMPMPDAANDDLGQYFREHESIALSSMANVANQVRNIPTRGRARELAERDSLVTLRMQEIENKLRRSENLSHPFANTTTDYVDFLIRATLTDAARLGMDRIVWTTPEDITLASHGQLEGNREFYGKIVRNRIQKQLKRLGPLAVLERTAAPHDAPVFRDTAYTEAEVDQAYEDSARLRELILHTDRRIQTLVSRAHAEGYSPPAPGIESYAYLEMSKRMAKPDAIGVSESLKSEITKEHATRDDFNQAYMKAQEILDVSLEDKKGKLVRADPEVGEVEVKKDPTGHGFRLHSKKTGSVMPGRFGTSTEAFEEADRMSLPFKRKDYMSIKLSPELRKQIMENGIDLFANNPRAAAMIITALRDAEQAAQSVGFRRSVAGGMRSPIIGTGRKGKTLIKDIAKHFDAQHMEKYGRKLDPIGNPQDMDTIIAGAASEIQHQQSQPVTGEGWYGEDVEESFRQSTPIVPRLAESEPLRVLSTFMTAITSGIKNPVENWEAGMDMLEAYEETGVVPTKKASGKNWGYNIAPQVNILNHLIGTMGEEGAARWLLSLHPVKELNEVRIASGYKKGSKVVGKMDDQLLGGEAFGAKYGPFGLGMNGFENTVSDRWHTRSYNRHIGRLSDVPKGYKSPATDMPRNSTERAAMKAWNMGAADEAGISELDGQAVLWYYEQQLYTDAGVPSEPQKFSEGAAKALQKRGFAAQPRDVRPSDEGQAGQQRQGAGSTLFSNPDEAAGLALLNQRDPLGFYSRASRSAAQIKQKKGPPGAMINRLKEGGVTDEEIRWTGLDKWMKSRKSVTKEEVQSYLLDNRIPIEKHLKVGGGAKWKDHYVEGGPITTPGGSNYREILFSYAPKKPGKPMFLSSHFQEPNLIGHVRLQDYPVTGGSIKPVDEAAYLKDLADWRRQHDAWKAKYAKAQMSNFNFDPSPEMRALSAQEPVRPSKSRTALLSEEEQSDWAQYGRAHGFSPGAREAKEALRTKVDDITADIMKLNMKEGNLKSRMMDLGFSSGASGTVTKLFATGNTATKKQLVDKAKLDEEMKDTKDRMRDLIKGRSNLLRSRVPAEEGPLITETSKWTEFLAKNIIMEAVDGGYKYIALKTGASQARRYRLEEDEAAGMITYYDGIRIDVWRKLLKEIDPEIKIETANLQQESRDGSEGEAIYLIRVTEAMEDAAGEGFSLMAGGVPFTDDRKSELTQVEHDPFAPSEGSHGPDARPAQRTEARAAR